jgi:broad specificity phosphatase PhoE
MPVNVVFETHSISEDNERGVATGWLPGRLAPRGRDLARELGRRRRDDGIDAVFASDLTRAVETAHSAFEGTTTPILLDWRLRECDYGALNGAPRDQHPPRTDCVDRPYPGGESWRQATDRVARFLDDLRRGWDGRRVLVIGHVATRIALDVHVNGADLYEAMAAEFEWQEGWEYVVRDREPERPRG